MAAFTIQSNTHQTLSDLKSLFNFISDFKNFQSVLPQDKVENFRYSENECSFTIKGITPMTVRMADKKPYESVLFTSDGLGKFNFQLRVWFTGEAEKSGECRVDLLGDLNPFILAMAEKPLQQLINTMAARLSELKEEDIKEKV